MGKFDFISGDDFRASLEADYSELESALKAKAYKAVHVLAGSIVEALLIDYLIAINYSKKRPLEMDLNGAISACKEEGVLSDRAEHFSQVIRSYRNLIHPGRVIRLSEVIDEDTAEIAYSLVNIIIKEISANKEKQYGYTAEQITTKIVSDSSTATILGHILKNVTEFEKGRLLLNLIPKMYFELLELDEPVGPALSSLATCFRLIYEGISDEVKKKVAKDFIRVLKEESQTVVYSYERKFFRCSDLSYYSQEDAQLVKQHLFSRLAKEPENISLLDGIGRFLTVEDAESFTDTIVRLYVERHSVLEKIDLFVINEFCVTNGDVDKAVQSRANIWIESFEAKGDTEAVDAVKKFLDNFNLIF